MTERVNVNGRITTSAEARVSPLDRGFLYGDSVYETIRTYGGMLFRLPQHLDRLRRSAERIDLPHERAPVEIEPEIQRTVEAAGNLESAVRVMLTRGVGPVGYDPGPAGPPTVVVHVRPCPVLSEESQREGVDVAVVPVTRNAVTSLDPAIKSGNLLNNFLAWVAADRRRAFEAILLDLENHLAEGASSNIFLVRSGRLLTPPLETGILPGITRDLVLGLARANGIASAEEMLTADDLRGADEAFLTSTLKGLLPVRRCDGWPIREGRPGPVTMQLTALFDALVQAETKRGSLSGSTLR